jgi:hypothetical protein
MMPDREWEERPDCERTFRFNATFCDCPTCGVHITSYREDNTLICETVMSRVQTLEFIVYCQKELYTKAVDDD